MEKLSRVNHFYLWDPERKPALTIKPGDTVRVETLDNTGGRIRTEQDYGPESIEEVNPSTGPIYVEGAEPGDALAVKVERIVLQEKGHIQLIPGFGLMKDQVNAPKTKIVPVSKNGAVFTEDLVLPLNPMIGCIGTTPLEPIYTIHSGDFGGNMDNKRIAEGSTVYLPVFVKGGLLALGDLHASMGDGELCCTGIEISGEVMITVELIKEARISRPIVETETHWITTGQGKTVNEGIVIAATDMAERLSKTLEISIEEAVMLVSAKADSCVSQSVPNAAKGTHSTVRVEFPKIGRLTNDSIL